MKINGISTKIDDGALDVPLANGVSPSLYYITAIKDLSKVPILDN